MNSKLFKVEKEKLSDENNSFGENSNDKFGNFKLSVEAIGKKTKTVADFKMSEIKTGADLKSKMDVQESKTNGMITETNMYPGAGPTRPTGVNTFSRNTDTGSNSSSNSFLPRIQSSGGVSFSNNRFGASNREGCGNYMHNIPQGPTPFCRGGPPLRFKMTPRPVLSRITFPVRGKVWQPDGDDEDEEIAENKNEVKKNENKGDKDAKKLNEEDKTLETEQKKQDDEEDIDLYGDIVTAADKSDNSGVEDEHSSYSALGPPPVPPAFLLNLDENVESYITKINDKSEEYDPAEPWDSEDEMVIDENKELTPERKELEEKTKKEEDKIDSPKPTPSSSPLQKPTRSSLSPCESTSPISPVQKLTSPVSVAAISTFPSSPKKETASAKLSDDDDDEDCPIFSIYSKATKKFSQKDDEERRLRSVSVESENQIIETKENKKSAKEKTEDKDLSWKKPSKKDKNYREGKKKSKERAKSKSYERKKSRSLSPKKDKKKNKERKKKTEKKKELERYDVRKIVKNKEMRKTDAFGRDIISKSRSISRSPTIMPVRERSRNMLRRRSRSFSRSRSLSRSRSFSRSRSRSFRKRSLGRRRYNRSRSRSRSESLRRSYSRSKSRSRSRKSKKKFKPKERMKFRSRSRGRKSRSISRGRRRSVSRSRSRSPRVVRNKKRVRRSWSEVSRSPSFSPTRSRSVSLSPIRVRRSYSRSISTSWSRGRSPIPRAQSLEKLTVVLTTKNKKKKKKEWKKSRKEEKKRKRAGNSKEVFTSGDNVLVSVNFNNGVSDDRNSRLNSASPEPTEIRKKKKGSDNENEKIKKKSNAISKKAVDLALSGPTRVKKLTRLSEKDAEVILNRKPVAVIDLDMSPYREQTPSPVNVVVVSDSGSGDEGKEHAVQPVNPPHKGPNTPPAPRGPTTPKTPPSPQTSPDAYDPFEPTKSRSLSPSQADKENRPSPKPTDNQAAVVDEGNETVSSSSDKDATIEKEGAKEVLEKSEAAPIVECSPNVISSQTPVIDIAESPDRKTAVVTISTPQKTQPPAQTTHTSSLKPISVVTTSTSVDAPLTSISLTVTSMPSPTKTSRVTTTTTQTLQVTGIQRLQDRLGSPVNKTPNSVKSTPEKRSDSNETLSSGNYKIRNGSKRNGDQPKQARPLQDATNETIDVPPVSDDSPYSPASSEGDDLFDPPPETGKATQMNSKPPLPYKPKPVHKDNTKPLSKFDLLFGPSLSPLMVGNKKSNSKVNSKFFPPSKKSSVKKNVMHKMDEDQLKILDELPSSAVELQVKDKFLKKLNRQERVVDEVKTVLKPHYARKHITKEEYKDILRRSVPKICHSKSGEINPSKIQFLIEAYVKKCRHAKKKLTNTLS